MSSAAGEDIAADPRLLGVCIRCSDPRAAALVFAAIAGAPATQLPNRGYRVTFGDAVVTLFEATGESAARGLEAITVAVAAPGSNLEALRQARAIGAGSPARVVVAPVSANGLEVEIVGGGATGAAAGATPAARFDHVAVLVRDVRPAVSGWATILGIPPRTVAPHPLGHSDAARFELGSRMIELIAPSEGAATPLRRRLETSGEGALALALVARNLDETIRAVAATGAEIVRQPPHVFVHPRHAGGVLVQLTPRLAH